MPAKRVLLYATAQSAYYPGEQDRLAYYTDGVGASGMPYLIFPSDSPTYARWTLPFTATTFTSTTNWTVAWGIRGPSIGAAVFRLEYQFFAQGDDPTVEDWTIAADNIEATITTNLSFVSASISGVTIPSQYLLRIKLTRMTAHASDTGGVLHFITGALYAQDTIIDLDYAGATGLWVDGLRLTSGVTQDELLTVDADGDVVSSGDTEGPQGAQGEQGSTGAQGAQGEQGDDGEQGPQGDDGSQGEQGYQGSTGAQGTAGADSTVPGPQGAQGSVGEQGSTGAQGAAGEDSSVPGPQGSVGEQGPQGAQGEQGEQGPQGEPG